MFNEIGFIRTVNTGGSYIDSFDSSFVLHQVASGKPAPLADGFFDIDDGMPRDISNFLKVEYLRYLTAKVMINGLLTTVTDFYLHSLKKVKTKVLDFLPSYSFLLSPRHSFFDG